MKSKPKMSPKEDFFESRFSESRPGQNKASEYAIQHEQPKTKEQKMLYTITSAGKIRLHRDLSKWRKPVGKNEYFEVAQSPHEATQEREFKTLIARCTKELGLDQECAVAVKNMKKQEYLDSLAG
ncbi:MAG: hypothetical protein ACRCZI_06700 [Cetobacterium sp.]